MVHFATPGRPPIAYFAILSGDISAAFLAWSLGDDIASILALVLAVFFAAAILGFLGVTLFSRMPPKVADEAMFLNAAFLAGIAALAGKQLWNYHGDPWLALGAIFAYVGLVLGAASIWLGIRADRRYQTYRKGGSA